MDGGFVGKYEQAGRMAEEEGEAGTLPSRESDAGLNPQTLGAWPELKAHA